MEIHSPVDYLHGSSIGERSYAVRRNSYYSNRYSVDENEPIVLHPLIIGKDIVVCMPEVNRVLRNVYQVLSQANYYLSKHGISSRRYTGAQLIRIKMLGILGHEAKVCSYILQRDAERIFDSFDVSGDSRKSSRIQWMEPILLDEKPMPPANTKVSTNSSKASSVSEPLPEGPVNVHLFKLGEDIIICAPEVQRVVQSNFHQGATVGYYFTKLGIVPYKFIHTAHLDKMKELGIIKKCAVHCTYILQSDALRVFEAYGMTQEIIDSHVNYLDVITLEEGVSHRQWKSSSSSSIKSEPSPSMLTDESPKRDCFSPSSVASDHSKHQDDDVIDADNTNGNRQYLSKSELTVHVFIVESQEVVCMPDIHKIVQNIHGNSIQVNYYFNKLKVQKKRFCFAHLRELKSRHILQNNATYCTYVPKADAEKLFHIYCFVDDPKLKEIQWSEPVNLDGKLSRLSASPSEGMLVEDNKEVCDDEICIHTFNLDSITVITVPDVHRIVDFLDEQSASLDYHFRKLGINKCRFTYAQLHQLRRLNVIKRPTVCTYISREDVNRLLKMYETERNKHRMNAIKFLSPIVLVRGTPSERFKTEKSPPTPNNHSSESYSGQVTPEIGPTNAAQLFHNQTSPVETLSPPNFMKPTETPATPSAPIPHGSEVVVSPNSAAISHLQNIHPSLDCPIVIPSGDYDLTKANPEHEQTNGVNLKRGYEAHPAMMARKRFKCMFFLFKLDTLRCAWVITLCFLIKLTLVKWNSQGNEKV